MKQLIYILLLLSCPAFAQQEKDSIVINKHTYYFGETYLDSVKIDLDKTYLNPKNLQSIQYLHTKDKRINGCNRARLPVLFINRKKKEQLISLNDILSAERISNNFRENEKLNLIVDGKLIDNPELYCIESGYIKKISIVIDRLYSSMSRESCVYIITKSNKKKK